MINSKSNIPQELIGGSVDVSLNTSAEYFEKERKVFANLWHRVAFEFELPDNGSFVVKQINVLNLSILISRGRDGVIRAFHNICTHRGNRLVSECKGKSKAFICGFHSWAFDTEGKLIFVMEEDDFDNLDKSKLGLIPIHSGVWNGMVFVNAAAEPRESLEDFLAPLDDRLGTFDVGSMRPVGRYFAKVEANWKTTQDAFMEAYHVRTVHGRSLPHLRNNWIPREIEALGKHTTMAAFQKIMGEPKPTEAFVWKLGTGFMKADEKLELPEGLNAKRRDNWVFDQFSVFPNQLFMVGGAWFTHHEFWPLTVDTCLWSASYLVRPTDSPLQTIANEFYKARVRDTVLEDLASIEAMHASHRSGALKELVICGQEAQILRHRVVLQDYINTYVGA